MTGGTRAAGAQPAAAARSTAAAGPPVPRRH